jgi:hypothetical protein
MPPYVEGNSLQLFDLYSRRGGRDSFRGGIVCIPPVCINFSSNTLMSSMRRLVCYVQQPQ